MSGLLIFVSVAMALLHLRRNLELRTVPTAPTEPHSHFNKRSISEDHTKVASFICFSASANNLGKCFAQKRIEAFIGVTVDYIRGL